MLNTLIGQKIDQSQNFLQDGRRIPVTEISIAENVVMQVKTVDTDSYSAVQLGAGIKKKANKSQMGFAKKAGQNTAPFKIKEISIDGEDLPKTGDLITLDSVFKPGDLVQITGTSKGKGFAGVVRRYNFRGGPKTHGQSDRHRAPGSIGQSTTPGRVYKGKRMAGRMGSDTVTVKNLTVVDVDVDNKKLYVLGLVPGHRKSWVVVRRIGEDKKFVPLLSTKEPEAVKTEDVAESTEKVKVETETVITPEKEVKTVSDTVEEAVETVETSAETVKTAEDAVVVAEEVRESKTDSAQGSVESKEENA